MAVGSTDCCEHDQCDLRDRSHGDVVRPVADRGAAVDVAPTNARLSNQSHIASSRDVGRRGPLEPVALGGAGLGVPLP